MENNFAMPSVCLWSKGVSSVIDFHGLSAFSFVDGRVQSRLLNCPLHLLSFNRSWKEIVQRLLSSVSFWKIHSLLYFDRWLVKEVLTGWGKGGGASQCRERREVSCCFWGFLTQGEWLLCSFSSTGSWEEFADKASSWKTAVPFLGPFRGLCLLLGAELESGEDATV